MKILVSFNNTYQSPGYPVLGVLDPQAMSIRFVEWPAEVPETGVLGLACSSKHLFLGIQYSFDATQSYRVPPEVGIEYSADGTLASCNPCGLLILDRHDLRVVNHHVFEKIADVHSFLMSEDERTLFVVSTGTDEVIAIELDGATVLQERVVWRPATATDRVDNHHLNSIIKYKGDILVSGFGLRTIADDWNSAQDGFVCNISTGDYILRGLQQPHSLAIIDGELACCESKGKRILYLKDNQVECWHDVGGYSRGLCELSGSVFVGTSARRQRSKSTGKLNKPTQSDDVGCTISRFDADGKFAMLQLDELAQEIYEMIPIAGTENWPMREEINYKKRFQQAWQQQAELAINEIEANVIPDLPLIVIDEMILGLQPESLTGVQLHSFIEKDGMYWGPPENDDVAIAALEGLEKAHKRLVLALAWPAFWWMDAFPLFQKHIEAHYKPLLRNHRVQVYALR
jgi:hypothetical protein